MISAKIISDSVAPNGDRLTTFLIRFPRFILPEVLTHRFFSRNTASTRAIPILKFRKDVEENPAEPVFWGANQPGMQASQELSPDKIIQARKLWFKARDLMLEIHAEFEQLGLHKQISNRCIELFFNVEMLVSSTNFGNFFALRSHSAAQPEIQALSDLMLLKYVESTPKSLSWGELHLPYGEENFPAGISKEVKVKICVARCARLSYKNFEGKIDVQSDIELHDKLVASGHMSPTEHVAACVQDPVIPQRRSNFSDHWIQYRKTFENECQEPDYANLLAARKSVSKFSRGEV